MLKPFEIELLQQDLKAALKFLGQDEIDDAHSLMRDRGFRSDDFEILQKADPLSPFSKCGHRNRCGATEKQ